MLLDRASQRPLENGARLPRTGGPIAALSAAELAKLHAERSGRRANSLALRGGSIGRAVKALTNGPRASSGEATLAKLRVCQPWRADA